MSGLGNEAIPRRLTRPSRTTVPGLITTTISRMNPVGAVALILVGLAIGAVSSVQATTGRYIGVRKLRTDPSKAKIQAGGWVGVALAVVAVFLGASWLTSGVASAVLVAVVWIVLAVTA